MKRQIQHCKHYWNTVNNIDYEIFHEIVHSILIVYALLQKKYLRVNHATSVTKEFQKEVLKRLRLERLTLKIKWSN